MQQFNHYRRQAIPLQMIPVHQGKATLVENHPPKRALSLNFIYTRVVFLGLVEGGKQEKEKIKVREVKRKVREVKRAGEVKRKVREVKRAGEVKNTSLKFF